MANHLGAVQVWQLANGSGAVVVDLGTPGEFAQGHPRGAINLPFSEKGLEQRLRGVLPAGSPVILIAATPEQEELATAQLTDGPFPLLGVLEGGSEAWQAADLPVDTLAEVSVQDLAAASSQEMVVLDVREAMEWETGHVPGAILISLGQLRQHLQAIPRLPCIAVICEAGVRSSTAASILRAEGFRDVANVPEGTGGYRRAGLPLQFPDGLPQGGHIGS